MAVLNHQNSCNLSAKIPLKLLLIIPFVLQIVMAVGVTGWFSVRYGKKAVNEVATQLRYEVSQRIAQKLSEYLRIPHQVNQVTLDTLELGYLQIEDFPKLQNHFIKQVQRFDLIDSVFFGSETNEFIGIAHGRDDRLQLMRAGKATGGSIHFHWLNEQNRPIELIKKTPNFPIRDRPWYKVAVESEQEIWGPIFTYHAYPRMAIPASVAIRDEAGNLIGVLGNNFFLTQISEFLATLKIGKSGQTFILERSGNLVASSSLPQPFVIENGVAQRIHASESQDPIIQATTAHLLESLGSVVCLRDISERRQAQLSLWEREERLQAIFDQAAVGIALTLPSGKFVQVNQRFCQLLGYSQAELLNMTFRQLTHPEDLKVEEAYVEDLLSGISQTYSLEKRYLRKDGKVQWVYLAVSIVRDWIGEPTQLIGVVSDIHERKQMEVALQQATQEREKEIQRQLQQQAETERAVDMVVDKTRAFLDVETIFTTVTYEARQLLKCDRTLVYRLLSRSVVLTEQKDFLKIINNSAYHLLSLINDILDLSKIESGKLSLNISGFDLHKMLAKTQEMFILKAYKKSLHFQIKWEENVPQWVKGDESKLRQILINLLSNAIKFTSQGEVMLNVSKPSNPDRLQFEVQDTGPGIPMLEQDRIFEPFVQTSVGRQSGEGTGLGLSITQRFVQLMGGEIHFTCPAAGGTCFWFDIPFEQADPTQVSLSHKPLRVISLAPGQPTYRILVAEDVWEIRQLLVKLLRAVGFEVREASNGQETIEVWGSWQPHLIWMDMQMPVMNGYAATQTIRKSLQGQATIIIGLTDHPLSEPICDRCCECDDCMIKPFQESAIFETIAKYLGVRYLYGPMDSLTTVLYGTPTVLDDWLEASDLEGIAEDWVIELYHCAAGADADGIYKLLEQLSEDYGSTKKAIASLVDQFCFDRIMKIAQCDLNHE
ncbi:MULTISPECIES: PAS domain S-box protein [unclassified Roseofilum]|uniref:PAS domain S-box protein n=1 Tax=unclassified Roseofilum TaxID=2620099 RepID=UPI000E87CEDD|nr:MULTISPECIES: PAS domain S-box protein [unclassified Roseofilum]MBP0008805.1 PAS domain S-box protein [Roseofilum sp. Belize Diploria]MBP0033517.1 PAS domain S-box protein [Roseofilum sp. Belize BBD 4]HBQ99631.1 hypothetical protein [Cyanobacteria bacterium UBA11691]